MGDLEDLSTEEILARIVLFEQKGFYFYTSWTMDEPATPDRIEFPNEEIYSIGEIDKMLSNPKDPLFEDARNADEYYDLIRALNVHVRTGTYISSFRDRKDLEICRNKKWKEPIYP